MCGLRPRRDEKRGRLSTSPIGGCRLTESEHGPQMGALCLVMGVLHRAGRRREKLPETGISDAGVPELLGLCGIPVPFSWRKK